MEKSQLCNKERLHLDKLQKNLQLPHAYKKVGWGVFFTSLLVLIVLKIALEDISMYRPFMQKGMLLGLLIIAISKEAIEDELVIELRSKSFSLAFICGVLYAIIQPYINYVVAAILVPHKAIFEDLGGFVILWFMLVIHLMFFYVLKKTR